MFHVSNSCSSCTIVHQGAFSHLWNSVRVWYGVTGAWKRYYWTGVSFREYIANQPYGVQLVTLVLFKKMSPKWLTANGQRLMSIHTGIAVQYCNSISIISNSIPVWPVFRSISLSLSVISMIVCCFVECVIFL